MAGREAQAGGPASNPSEESRRLWGAAESINAETDPSGAIGALQGFLAFVETNRRGLAGDAAELAGHLDLAAMAFYRAAMPDLAIRAADAGLEFTPGSASLLHHKALVLLANDRNVAEALPLLDDALRAAPHDKGLWATRGDALRLLGRPDEAAEAYLTAQKLDASSTQYVDRALKTAPHHPGALRLKVDFARAHGGDRSGLAAVDSLLAQAPDDVDLKKTRAELLRGIGEPGQAATDLRALVGQIPEDRSARFLLARCLFEAGDAPGGLAELKALSELPPVPGSVPLDEMAALAEGAGGDAALALSLRRSFAEAEPRNVANLLAYRDLALRSQKLDAAEEASRKILEVSPDNLEAARGLAEIQAQKGQLDAAFGTYRTLLAAHPEAIGEARRALEAAGALGRSAEVAEFAELVLRADPKDLEARRLRAEGLRKAGQAEAALAEYERWIADAPDEIAPRLAQKEILIGMNATERLAPVYDELFRLDPTRSDLALERANLALAHAFEAPEGSADRKEAARIALVSYERASSSPERRGASELGIARAARLLDDLDRAVQAYRQFLEVPANATRSEVRKELGHALREAGRLTEAEAEYAQAIQRGLDETDLVWGEVEVLAQLNQEGRALRLVDLLLQREPANPLFLRRKGQLLLKMGRRPEGILALRSAVDRSGADPHVLFEVAEALRVGGAYADAVGFYRQGLAVDPRSRPGRLALAETLLLAGQYPEAIPAIDGLLKEDPNDPRAWRARADAFRSLGRSDEVLYSLKAILLLEPHNGAALTEKARLHLERTEKRDAYEALAALTRAGGAESQDGGLWLQVGDLAAELGETEEANRAFERAAQLDPSHGGEIGLRRARLRLAAGRPDLALEVLDAEWSGAPLAAERPIASLLLRAEILSALERPGDAQLALEEVRKREPRSPAAVGGLARALLDQGKHTEARALLRESLPQLPAQPILYLLLAEAETGLGQMTDAIEALRRGTQALPKSPELWVRLGESEVAREAWSEASDAFGHAIALAGQDAGVLLRAGFVADRLGHPNEALALYDRATVVAPGNKDAWCQRGLALLAVHRPEEALPSFERSLALESDYAPAKDGKKAALQMTREAQIERLGREALLLEARLNRAVTRNDLFVTLHAPFDYLEPVLGAIARQPKISLDHLSEAELQDLESASYRLIATALERRPEGIERRGLALADVAVLSPPTDSLDKIQRLFGYLKAVLEADLRPENLRLAPDVEELARRALQLPEGQRTLFQIVRNLRVGIYKARLIKIVEAAGSGGHAPVPALDLGQYTPEFRPSGPAPAVEGDRFFAPEAVPSWDAGPIEAPPSEAPSAPPSHPKGSAKASKSSAPAVEAAVRCVGCGGLASVAHACGATLCGSCLSTFRTCPKCQQGIQVAATRSLHPVPQAATGPVVGSHGGTHAPAHPAAHPAARHPTAPTAPGHATASTSATHPATAGRGHPSPNPTPRAPPTRVREANEGAATGSSAGRAEPGPGRHHAPAATDDPVPERPPRPAHRTDEEPRL